MTIGNHLRADQRGFTLAELLVAIAILGMIMLGVMTLLMTGNQSYLTGSNQVEAQAALRAALERTTTDLREGGYDPQGRACTAAGTPSGCFDAITAPSATSFTIQSDWNGTGPAAPATPIEPAPFRACVAYTWAGGDAFCPVGTVSRGEQITYSIVGGNLQRQESAVDAQPQILVTSVEQASVGVVLQPYFQYLDTNGNEVVNPAANAWQIRTVVVQMRAGVQNQPPAIWQAGFVRVTMSDRIRLRNR